MASKLLTSLPSPQEWGRACADLWPAGLGDPLEAFPPPWTILSASKALLPK